MRACPCETGLESPVLSGCHVSATDSSLFRASYHFCYHFVSLSQYFPVSVLCFSPTAASLLPVAPGGSAGRVALASRWLRAGAVGRSRAPLGPLSHSLAGLLNDFVSREKHDSSRIFRHRGTALERGRSGLPLWGSPGSRRSARPSVSGKTPFNGKARLSPGLVPCLPVQPWLVSRYSATPA